MLPGAKTLQNPKVSFVGDAARMAVLHNSGVGATLAVVILGLRDRHKDNMMISADGTLFHIDFGYIGGLTPRFDFTDLPIPQRLQTNLDFEKFVADCGLAYNILREQQIMMLSVVMSLICSEDMVCVVGHISQVFKYYSADDVMTMVINGPNAPWKRVKNFYHTATQMFSK